MKRATRVPQIGACGMVVEHKSSMSGEASQRLDTVKKLLCLTGDFRCAVAETKTSSTGKTFSRPRCCDDLDRSDLRASWQRRQDQRRPELGCQPSLAGRRQGDPGRRPHARRRRQPGENPCPQAPELRLSEELEEMTVQQGVSEKLARQWVHGMRFDGTARHQRVVRPGTKSENSEPTFPEN
eukprot:TRINITY_DN2167_c0_g1_i5.p2 TRINITY_DN2167_c0_g1~~TRINITY_DN2167_c0_g1_i5.p2  ORF type:complete len:182 (+),score=4.73 TRINITY_DN2167_c0_g1_i5:239-784(+)